MVLCIVALPVLLVLGIFSMRYRLLAKEAFDCIFRMVSFRPCKSRIDQRIKSGVSGRLMKNHPKTARFVYKNFSILSWIFAVALIASIILSVWGVVNFAVYGDCNGPEPGAFCIYSEIEQGVSGDNIDRAVRCEPGSYSSLENGNSS